MPVCPGFSRVVCCSPVAQSDSAKAPVKSAAMGKEKKHKHAKEPLGLLTLCFSWIQ